VTTVATPAEALAHPQFVSRAVWCKRARPRYPTIGPLARRESRPVSRHGLRARGQGSTTVEILSDLGCDAVVINIFLSAAQYVDETPPARLI